MGVQLIKHVLNSQAQIQEHGIILLLRTTPHPMRIMHRGRA